jgi:hypothetical protein
LLCYNFFVRRYLIIFFIVFLPFQFAWGAAAGYCAHEKGDEVIHFGHHAHVHKTATQSDEAAMSISGSSDLDCGYCHSGGAKPPPTIAGNLAAANPSIYVPPEIIPIRFRAPNPIERPNWSLAV